MKKIVLLTIALMIGLSSFAQDSKTISYQSVLRNLDGTLMVNETVDISFAIVDKESFNNILYMENHLDVVTGAHGLVTLEIGGGVPVYGTFEDLDWDLAYAVRVYLSEELLTTSVFTTTPYAINAMVAKEVKGVDFSEFLTKEDIPEDKDSVYVIPTLVSELENDKAYITLEDLPEDKDSVYVIPTMLSELKNDLDCLKPDTLNLYLTKVEADSLHAVTTDKILEINSKLTRVIDIINELKKKK